MPEYTDWILEVLIKALGKWQMYFIFLGFAEYVILSCHSFHLILYQQEELLLVASRSLGVAAEIIGMPKGSVGQMLYMSKIYLDTDDLLAWTVIIVVLSVIFEKLVVLALKAALKK